jgi:hypothetical protein
MSKFKKAGIALAEAFAEFLSEFIVLVGGSMDSLDEASSGRRSAKKDDDDEDEKPKPRRRRKPKEDDDDEDEKPKPRRGKKKDDDEEEEKPKPRRGKKKGPTADDVRKALRAYAKENGKDASHEILDDLGVKSVSEMEPEQYQEAIELMEF